MLIYVYKPKFLDHHKAIQVRFLLIGSPIMPPHILGPKPDPFWIGITSCELDMFESESSLDFSVSRLSLSLLSTRLLSLLSEGLKLDSSLSSADLGPDVLFLFMLNSKGQSFKPAENIENSEGSETTNADCPAAGVIAPFPLNHKRGHLHRKKNLKGSPKG